MHPLLMELASDVIRGTIIESSEDIGYDGDEYAGWYCIQIKPCTCVGCGRVVCYVEPDLYHVIIIWEENDDKYILKIAAKIKELGLDPRIVTYYPILGKCIPWEKVAELSE